MRLGKFAVLGIVLFGLPVFGQTAYQPYFTYGTVDMTSATDNTLLSYSGAGWLSSVACRVTNAPSGVYGLTLKLSLDGNITQMLDVYGYMTSYWASGTAPFQNAGSSTNPGSTVGDTFLLPFNVAFSSSVSIIASKGVASTAGQLTCSIIWGH